MDSARPASKKAPGPANGTKAKAKQDRESAKRARQFEKDVENRVVRRKPVRSWDEARQIERRREANKTARKQRVYNARRKRK